MFLGKAGLFRISKGGGIFGLPSATHTGEFKSQRLKQGATGGRSKKGSFRDYRLLKRKKTKDSL